MPASRFGILSPICNSAVTAPATAPHKSASDNPHKGAIPLTRHTAMTAAPIGKEPSTVRSGKSSILNVIKTPSTISP